MPGQPSEGHLKSTGPSSSEEPVDAAGALNVLAVGQPPNTVGSRKHVVPPAPRLDHVPSASSEPTPARRRPRSSARQCPAYAEFVNSRSIRPPTHRRPDRKPRPSSSVPLARMLNAVGSSDVANTRPSAASWLLPDAESVAPGRGGVVATASGAPAGSSTAIDPRVESGTADAGERGDGAPDHPVARKTSPELLPSIGTRFGAWL